MYIKNTVDLLVGDPASHRRDVGIHILYINFLVVNFVHFWAAFMLRKLLYHM